MPVDFGGHLEQSLNFHGDCPWGLGDIWKSPQISVTAHGVWGTSVAADGFWGHLGKSLTIHGDCLWILEDIWKSSPNIHGDCPWGLGDIWKRLQISMVTAHGVWGTFGKVPKYPW